MEPLQLPCPHCGQPVLYPGYWCDDCRTVAFPGVYLDSDSEPNGDEEPDDDVRLTCWNCCRRPGSPTRRAACTTSSTQ